MKPVKAEQLKNKDYEFLYGEDIAQINHPNPLLARLHADRIYKIVSYVSKYFQKNASCLEIGSAQASISLLLAEKGFHTVALDINKNFLGYAKMKYEKGDIYFIHTDALKHFPFEAKSFDVIILGEFLEHIAYPEIFLRKLKKYLKNNGKIIITAPNGNYFLNKMKTFSNIRNRKALLKVQSGPAGESHLFLFTKKELEEIVKNERFKIILSTQIHTYFRRYYILFPSFFILFLIKFDDFLSKMPFIGKKLAKTLFMVIEK
jgi:2-polyprenyl-6-hydroxyphenyl methylase/3-demethylubiquinone-9 3-methyltransferase